MDAEANNHSQHIVILPIPGASHLIPIVELTRRLLLLDPSLSFTFLLISSSSTPSVISTLPAAFYDVITLPAPLFGPFTDILDETATICLRSINHSLPVIRQTLREIVARRKVLTLVVDIFATEAVEVAAELGIKSYICFTPSAIALSLFIGIPEVDETLPSGNWDPDMPLKFPGCPMIRVRHVPDPILDRDSIYFKWFLEHSRRYKSVEGIILNSFDPLESGPIRALRNPSPGKPLVYAVGPIVRTGSERNDCDSFGCLRWLDEQPQESVLYVSFGSGGTLSSDQVTELAWGLELSEQRFLWVVRRPNDSAAFGTYLGSDEKEVPLGFLPKGFVERTKGRGLVVQSWAPQVEILGHSSTGGFMTHCGWNSVLEGVVNGVGFIAWPLYAEQHMNALELVEEVKVALSVEKDKDGIARRDEIARVAKALMEGEKGREIKERMKTLKEEAKRAVNKDGSSIVTLSELVLKWKTA